jgi:hypothetical protein
MLFFILSASRVCREIFAQQFEPIRMLRFLFFIFEGRGERVIFISHPVIFISYPLEYAIRGISDMLKRLSLWGGNI